jgi:hypothetical protein
MKPVPRLRPSPSMAVAFTALLVSLGGTGYAVVALPANSVGSKQLKKSAVTTAKVKSSAITGAKVRANSLLGADILESSLGKVPSAAAADTAGTAASAGSAATAATATNAVNAANAARAATADNAGNADKVGGLTIRRFNYNVDNNGPKTTLVELHGYKLLAACAAGQIELKLYGPPPPVNPELTGFVVNLATNVVDDVQASFGDFEQDLLAGTGGGRVVGHAEASNNDASTGAPSLSLDYATNEGVGTRCIASGVVIG